MEHLAICAADPSSAKAWLNSFEERFDVLLRRAIRVRNAITHAGITVPAVVTSVVPFVTALESLVLGARHWAFVESTESAAKHQQWRIRALDLKRRLEAGEDLAFLAADWSGQWGDGTSQALERPGGGVYRVLVTALSQSPWLESASAHRRGLGSRFLSKLCDRVAGAGPDQRKPD